PLQRSFGGQERLRDLLRDRRPALGRRAGAQVRGQRAADAAIVDALVLIEAAVLRGQERVDQLRRELVEREDLAPLGGQLGQRRPVGGAHHRRRRGDLVIRRDVGQRRQRRGEVDVGA